MRYLKAHSLAVCVVVAHGVFSAGLAHAGFVPLVTKDATQPSTNPQDDFEEVLAGDKTSLFTGQFLNPFSAPNSATVSFDPTTNSTIVHFAGQPIPGNPTAFQTVGYAINAVSIGIGGPIVNPDNKDGYWTPGVTIPGHVPEQNIMAQYMPATNQARVTISNDPGTFSLFSVGYLVTSAPFALASLNRGALPPSAFVPSGIPDGTMLTNGDSVSFTISGIAPDQYVTVFADAQFSGDSSGNFYTDLSGRWLEFQASSVPEPASASLYLIGIGIVLARVLRRRCPSATTRSWF